MNRIESSTRLGRFEVPIYWACIIAADMAWLLTMAWLIRHVALAVSGVLFTWWWASVLGAVLPAVPLLLWLTWASRHAVSCREDEMRTISRELGR